MSRREDSEAGSSSTSRRPIAPPVRRVDLPQNPAQPREEPSLAFMKNELEAMKLRLEREGHTIHPNMRAHLEKSIQDLLNRVVSSIGSSSS